MKFFYQKPTLPFSDHERKIFLYQSAPCWSLEPIEHDITQPLQLEFCISPFLRFEFFAYYP